MDKETIRDYELDIIVKAWRDEAFRKKLIDDPKRAIEDEFKIKVPHEINVFVHEEHENALHLIVPSLPPNFAAGDLTDEELKEVIGGVMATGHLSTFPSSKERSRLRMLQKENNQLKKMMEKLERDLSQAEAQLMAR